MDNDFFSQIYGRLSNWLTDVKRHELTHVVELVEHSKMLLRAAEQLPEEKIDQFVDNLVYDLKEFYLQHQQEAKHSLYLSLMSESFWAVMANITDKSQVEWAELLDDFEHDGLYQQGDIIGFGIIECTQCQKTLQISHLTKISECLHCGHHYFFRKSLTP